MGFTDKDFKKIFLIAMVLILALVSIIILRPVAVSIIAGLILAYMFLPIYSWIRLKVKNRNLAATIVTVLVILIILVPLLYLTPLMIDQVSKTFQVIKTLDFYPIVSKIFPGQSSQFLNQIVLILNNATNQVSSYVLNQLVDLIFEFPKIALHVLLVGFVFFFTLRDHEYLSSFMSQISPLNKTQEKNLVKQFKDITESIIYGQIVIGIFQGILAGIGFVIFGIDNSLLLTFLAVIFSVVPIVGPGIVYIPVAILLFASGQSTAALIFLAYNVLIVSTIDNLLRSAFVSRRANISQVIILIGMIGGLFVFGILGLLLGPLILAYLLTLLKAYKDRSLSSLFSSE